MSGNDEHLCGTLKAKEAYKWRHCGERDIMHVIEHFYLCQLMHFRTKIWMNC